LKRPVQYSLNEFFEARWQAKPTQRGIATQVEELGMWQVLVQSCSEKLLEEEVREVPNDSHMQAIRRYAGAIVSFEDG